MTVNTLPDPVASLGSFLRDRRSRLQPGADAQGRRRTPGLRREEVAMRANVSVAWYTWLEQGRGGPPSDEVLERLARALELEELIVDAMAFAGRLGFVCEADARYEEAQPRRRDQAPTSGAALPCAANAPTCAPTPAIVSGLNAATLTAPLR